jgi:NAD(P)-dependent dehydrogenase (short-subunit alcohol dehydrogenase family)
MAGVALVTGASSGIGFAAAKQLREAGHVVYATARRLERMRELERHGVRLVRADISVPDDVEALVSRVLDEQGRLDVLVNNAGYGPYGSLEELPMDEARRQVEVNLMALGRITQAALPHMRARRFGRIINVSSIGGRVGEPIGAWYHATKFAVEGLSDSLRLELAPFGIDVVVVEPGAIKTEWGEVAAENLRAVSGQGPYAEQARLGAAVLSTAAGADPKAIADVIVRAATAQRPRTRYVAPASARAFVFLRWLLPDRAFDRVFMRFYELAAAPSRR